MWANDFLPYYFYPYEYIYIYIYHINCLASIFLEPIICDVKNHKRVGKTAIKSVNTIGSKTDQKQRDAFLYPNCNLSPVITVWDGGV